VVTCHLPSPSSISFLCIAKSSIVLRKYSNNERVRQQPALWLKNWSHSEGDEGSVLPIPQPRQWLSIAVIHGALYLWY
jgi:hypothetical protein